MILTFKYRLLPRKGQHRRLRAALEHTRALYNAALEERIGAYQKVGETRAYMVQCKGLTDLRADPEYREFPVSLQRWPLKRLDQAFKAYFARSKRGERPGFPRFRGEDRFNSFGFSDSSGWKVDGGRLCMKGIGRVRVHLHRPMPSKPISCQVKRDGKGWVVLLACETPIAALPATGRQIGLDLGISSFIATSTGEAVPGFKAARRAQGETRRRQRALARCVRGSSRRKKVKLRLLRWHEHIASSRRTFHHQVATRLVRENDLIAIEDLNVKGLARSALARDVNDAGWSAFTQLLIEKAAKAARTVVKVDPRFTSQACSACGQIVPKTLAQRTHRCDCGYEADRDVNAAVNVLNRAVAGPGVAKLRSAAA